MARYRGRRPRPTAPKKPPAINQDYLSLLPGRKPDGRSMVDQLHDSVHLGSCLGLTQGVLEMQRLTRLEGASPAPDWLGDVPPQPAARTGPLRQLRQLHLACRKTGLIEAARMYRAAIDLLE